MTKRAQVLTLQNRIKVTVAKLNTGIVRQFLLDFLPRNIIVFIWSRYDGGNVVYVAVGLPSRRQGSDIVFIWSQYDG